jgi:hypothetical protein
MSYQFTQKWYRNKLSGLGSAAYIGPDQPWTAATASKWITERTRQCDAGHRIIIKTTPPTYYGAGPDGYSKKLPVAGCYATGRIKETAKAGSQRVQEWCCPPYEALTVPITRQVTQAEAEQYATNCAGRTLVLPSGASYALDLGWWLHKTAGIPSAVCQDSGITDGDYRLLCCDPISRVRLARDKDGKVFAPVAAVGTAVRTADQIAQVTAAEAVQAAEDEAVLVAAQEPQPGFFQRYGLVLALGAGAIGIGVLAGSIGLIKRKRLNEKSEG